jgi:hypothetical protein
MEGQGTAALRCPAGGTSEEVQQLRQENDRLKQLVAELSSANMTLKKRLYWGCSIASGAGEWRRSGSEISGGGPINQRVNQRP